LVRLLVVDSAATLLLAILEIAQINVTKKAVDQTALATSAVLLPAAFVDRSIQLNQLTNAIPDKLFMLPKIDISVAIKQLANWLEPTFDEITLIDQVITAV
jgi:hypothetical protein